MQHPYGFPWTGAASIPGRLLQSTVSLLHTCSMCCRSSRETGSESKVKSSKHSPQTDGGRLTQADAAELHCWCAAAGYRVFAFCLMNSLIIIFIQLWRLIKRASDTHLVPSVRHTGWGARPKSVVRCVLPGHQDEPRSCNLPSLPTNKDFLRQLRRRRGILGS